MADPVQIRVILSRHPNVTTVEEAIDCCKQAGFEPGFWSVYFAARDAGHKLTRRSPKPLEEGDLRDLAIFFIALHKDTKQAMATLKELQDMNDAGTRIDWQSDKSSSVHNMELLVAQELADHAGSISQARRVVTRL